MNDRQFLWLQSAAGYSLPRFINFAEIVSAELQEGRLVMRLTSGDTANIEGPAIKDLLLLLVDRSMMANGEPPPDELVRHLKQRLTQ